MSSKPHLHSTLGAAIVSAFAFIIGLLNIEPMTQIKNFGEWYSLIIVLFASSVFYLVFSAQNTNEEKARKFDKYATQLFLLGFIVLIIVTVTSILMVFSSGDFVLIAEKIPYLVVGISIGLIVGKIFFKKISL